MKVYITGTGAEGCRTLTNEAAEAIESSKLLIGGGRMLKPYENSGKQLADRYLPKDISDILHSSDVDTAAVLLSGDCGFFSGAKKLLPYIKDMDVKIIPGISSMAYFCAKLGMSYENLKFVSLHGKSENIAINVLMNEKCFFLLDGGTGAAEVCERLCRYGLENVKVYIGEELGYDNERITSGTAAEMHGIKTDKLAVMITENPNHLDHIPSAITDDMFIRTSIPMTKAEVRCNAVAALKICKDSVCWDIGCGSGSVSAEMAFRCPDGMVCAFDKSHEAAGLTQRNAEKFGCDNIKVTEGICPDILLDAPAPQKVFIGGSSGNLKKIFDLVYQKNEKADIIVTAVSLETLNQAAECFAAYKKEPFITQIAVTRTRKVGSHTMLDAQNPVFMIGGKTL